MPSETEVQKIAGKVRAAQETLFAMLNTINNAEQQENTDDCRVTCFVIVRSQ